MFNYFYGEQAEQFAFYRIPKVLFTDPHFRKLSSDAKILYGLLLDRMNLSARNGWIDDQRRVYIIFTIDEVMDALGCADQKATKLFNDLEKNFGLIERKRQGLGKPNLIYVKNFISENEPDSLKAQFMNRDNHDSGSVKSTIPDSRKSRCNNTENNNTECSDTYPIYSSAADADGGCDDEGMRTHAQYQNYFEKTLRIESMIEEHPDEEETIRGIVDLLVDTCCSKRKEIVIAGDTRPFQVVKGRLMKLEPHHITYVLSSLMENTTKIRNMKQYLLASLYNAPSTVSSYYQAVANSDLAAKGII